LFGLLPAISASRIDVMALLKQGGSKGTVGTSNRLRHALIVAEVALSVILLAGAGLLIRGYFILQASGTGFSSTPLSMRVDMDLDGNPQQVQKRHAFFHELLSRIESLPGVNRAALVDNLPLTHSESVTFMEIEGGKEKVQAIDMRLATPAYFPAMGIRLIEGRLFDDQDAWGQPTHLLVTQAFVKRFFADKSPLGRRIKFPGASEDSRPGSRVIVGVVADVKHGTLEETPRAEVFGSIWQWGGGCCVHVVVEASGRREPLAAAMRQIARSIDASVTVSEVRSMEEIMSAANAGRRFQTSLLSIFAAIALMLALVGIYGLMTYSVKQRTPEFGIRMTLGASRTEILAMVLRQGVGMTAVGVAIGIGGALALTRILAASLYSVKATDPITFYAVPVLILLVSAAACFVPAWKATRIDPAIALQYE
jgi:predicted permease